MWQSCYRLLLVLNDITRLLELTGLVPVGTRCCVSSVVILSRMIMDKLKCIAISKPIFWYCSNCVDAICVYSLTFLGLQFYFGYRWIYFKLVFLRCFLCLLQNEGGCKKEPNLWMYRVSVSIIPMKGIQSNDELVNWPCRPVMCLKIHGVNDTQDAVLLRIRSYCRLDIIKNVTGNLYQCQFSV